ncbi:carboxylating nicotinate-nucleotide diphosphorylase [Actibacterium lipolyticum]|uniref:Probable nicotinate-nucleotide pyrophosphorylase [carboxylating] n=1 Tax=Actibacterium lipolyticum TaxID=1524263 RepID=A0A238L7K4_9RHOB|nr:carboxylating nicotinate-nucleotide diphosphorylase [Actibacterium lipolyticum]SMX51075.1 putative nicotinate-nucleotide pyrophosphorylase [carboxylating] [Actibacterium lipolyticum]
MNSRLPDLVLEPMVRNALAEDLGTYGDITTRTVIPGDTQYKARINAREAGVVSGMQIARIAFHLMDASLKLETLIDDGEPCKPGDVLMTIEGSAASILSAERVALNFAGRLTGIASLTAQYVELTKGTDARVTCTRKTTPGLRIVEKQAVLHGGGFNHRFSLSDAIMIKDNHIAAAGGIAPALAAVKAKASHMMRVEIEVDRLDQLAEVLKIGGADVVLLDNMSCDQMREAVAMNDGSVVLEASGNITLTRIAEVAATGVSYISSGALTHSAGCIDLGLDF